MQNVPSKTRIFMAVLLVCLLSTVYAEETVQLYDTASDVLFHNVLKDYHVKQIYTAAYDVMFSKLSLTRPKSEECNCTTTKVDHLTGKIIATSADGITFVFRIHYLDESSCGIWILAIQESDVPGDLKKYCQLIYDWTVERLEQVEEQTSLDAVLENTPMEFSEEYDISVEQMYKVINDTAGQLSISHGSSSRNHFTINGSLTSGQTRFSYKGYMVADDKMKFRFQQIGKSESDGDRYIYESICKEFQRQLKLQQLKSR